MTLNEYLKKNSLTQSDFGKMIGKDQRTISEYCGGYAPPRDVALKIVQVTKGKVTLEDLWDVKLVGAIPK